MFRCFCGSKGFRPLLRPGGRAPLGVRASAWRGRDDCVLPRRGAQAAPDTLGNRFSAIICRFMLKLWSISGVGGAWARRGKGVAARYRFGVGLGGCGGGVPG